MRYSEGFGEKSSKILLGTTYFGDTISDGLAFDIMDKYYELGGNHIDTARMYAGGEAEKVVARWIKSRKRYLCGENLKRLEIIRELSGKYKCSIAAIVCGAMCSMTCPDIFPIIGGSNVTQIADSMSGADVKLEKGELEKIFGFKEL